MQLTSIEWGGMDASKSSLNSKGGTRSKEEQGRENIFEQQGKDNKGGTRTREEKDF